VSNINKIESCQRWFTKRIKGWEQPLTLLPLFRDPALCSMVACRDRSTESLQRRAQANASAPWYWLHSVLDDDGQQDYTIPSYTRGTRGGVCDVAYTIALAQFALVTQFFSPSYLFTALILMLGLGVIEILTTLMWVPIFQCYSRLRCGQSLYEVHKEANESRFNTSSDGAM